MNRFPRHPSAVTLRAATLIAPLVAALIGAGCADEPNSAGQGLLPDTLRIVTATALATSDSTYVNRIGGSQTTLLVGTAHGLEARTVLRFTFTSFDTTLRIDSGVIRIRPSYRLPDSSGAPAFTAHAMTSAWSASTFRWDSVAGSFDPTPGGSFPGTAGSSDTVLSLRLDTALVRSWLRAGTGSVMFVPASGQTSVLGFHSHFQTTGGLQPVIEVVTRGAADTALRTTRNAVEGVFVAQGSVPSAPGLSVLQSGIAWRGLFRFDSLTLPRGAGIASAVLEVRENAALPPGPGATRDTLSVSFVQDRAFPLDTLVLTGFCLPVTENGVRFYRADIRTFVQLWNTREPNAGIVLRALGETTTLDRIGLHGAGAADSLRPRIRITYTEFP